MEKNLRSYPTENIFLTKQESSYSGPIGPDTTERFDFLDESMIGDLVLVKNSLAIVIAGVDSYPGLTDNSLTLIKRVFVYQSGKWKDLGVLATNRFLLTQQSSLRLSALKFEEESITYLFSPEGEWKLTDLELKFYINENSQLIISLSKSETSPAAQIELVIEGLFQESNWKSKKHYLGELARSNFMLSMDSSWSEQVHKDLRKWKNQLEKNTLEFELKFSRPAILAELAEGVADWRFLEISAFTKRPRLLGESLKLQVNENLLLKAYPGERLLLPTNYNYRLLSGKQTSTTSRLDEKENLLELATKTVKTALSQEQLEQMRNLQIRLTALRGSLFLADSELHEAKSFSFSPKEFSELELLAGSYRLSFHSEYAELCSENLQIQEDSFTSTCLDSVKELKKLAKMYQKTALSLGWQAIEAKPRSKLLLTNKETLILENPESLEENLNAPITLMEAKELSSRMRFAASCPSGALSEYLAMASALRIRKFYVFDCANLKDILSSLDLFQAELETTSLSLSASKSSPALGCIGSASCEDAASIGFSAALHQLDLKLVDKQTLKITAQAVSIANIKLGLRVWMIGLRPRLIDQRLISGKDLDIELKLQAQDHHLRLEIFSAADDNYHIPFASSDYLSIDKIRRANP